PLRPFFFFREKRNKKTRPLPPQQRGFCSRARLKISKGQVVFFEKITQKISTFKPLPIFIFFVFFCFLKARLSKNKIYIVFLIFILSVLFSLPKDRLSKNKIFIVFRCSSVTDKTTQKYKDTREVSRIFYSTIAPDCSTNLPVVHHVLIYQSLCYNYFKFIRRRIKEGY